MEQHGRPTPVWAIRMLKACGAVAGLLMFAVPAFLLFSQVYGCMGLVGFAISEEGLVRTLPSFFVMFGSFLARSFPPFATYGAIWFLAGYFRRMLHNTTGAEA